MFIVQAPDHKALHKMQIKNIFLTGILFAKIHDYSIQWQMPVTNVIKLFPAVSYNFS